MEKADCDYLHVSKIFSNPLNLTHRDAISLRSLNQFLLQLCNLFMYLFIVYNSRQTSE